MRIKYEVSAGGLVLRRRESAYDALLIGRGTPRIWTLPKGHVEHKESHSRKNFGGSETTETTYSYRKE